MKYRTIKDLAEAAGVSRYVVNRAIKSSLIDPAWVYTAPGGGHRKIRIEHWGQALEALSGNRQPPQAAADEAPAPAGGISAAPVDLATHRIEREYFEARRAELKYQQELGAVIPVDETRHAFQNILGMVVARCMQIPGQAAPALSAIDDPAELEQKLEDFIRSAFEDIRLEVNGIAMANAEDELPPDQELDAGDRAMGDRSTEHRSGDRSSGVVG